MATYYVAPTSGNDSNNGSIGSPFRTIAQGLSVLAAGDTLYLRGNDGVFIEGVIDSTSFGTSGSPILIAGYPSDIRPVVRAPSSYTTSIEAWYVAWSVSRVNRWLTMRYFEIDGINLPHESGACLQIQAPKVTCEDMIFRNPSRDGVRMFSRDLTLRNCHIINCGRVQPVGQADTKGLGFYMSPDIANDGAAIGGNNLVEDCLIEGCRGGGGVIHYGDGSNHNNNIVRRNLFRNFGDFSPWNAGGWPAGGYEKTATGVNVGGAGQNNGNVGPRNAKIENNIFINISAPDVAAGHMLWGADDIKILNNTYYNVSHYAYRFLCTTTNTNFRIQNNIWSLIGVAETNFTEPDMTCGVTFTPKTVSNNLFNPNVAATFVNAVAGNFYLVDTSSAINTGANLSAQGVTEDYDGTARPSGGSYDIGAYEWTAEGSPPEEPPPGEGPPTIPPPPTEFVVASTDRSLTVKMSLGANTVILSGLTFSTTSEQIHIIHGVVAALTTSSQVMHLFCRDTDNNQMVHVSSSENLTADTTLGLVIQAATIDSIDYLEGRYAGLKNVVVELIP